MSNPKLTFLVAEDWYFCSHRLALACAARENGFDVTVVTRVNKHRDVILDSGIQLASINLSRNRKNVLKDANTLLEIVQAYRRIKPDIVHQVALKPVLYGTLSAHINRVPVVINALAGLGYVFSSNDRSARCIRPFAEVALRAMLKPHPVIVQNPDDRRFLLERGLADPHQIALIAGSGVDISVFTPFPECPGIPLVVLPARLLWDKGVSEFVGAARILRRQGVRARFALVGEPDSLNPAAVPERTLAEWRAEGIVEVWGRREDMPKVLRECHIVCLPSYREGLPKVLLEGAASGRPLVSCDVPGCREVVRHGETGLLVPPRDTEALARALKQLVENPEQRSMLGRRARVVATNDYSLQSVIDQTLELYRTLLCP